MQAGQPHKFVPKLIGRQMHGSETPSSDLLLDYVLIDPVNGCIVTTAILRSSVERLFNAF